MWEGEYVNFSCVSTEKQPQYMVLVSIMELGPNSLCAVWVIRAVGRSE